LLTRIDAKGQKTQYTYDAYERLTEVQHYPSWNDGSEDPNQRWTFYYESNTVDTTMQIG
jgi:hypothetical protein